MKPEDFLEQLSQSHTQKCTMGCPILDRFLGGGIPCNSITELVAESGCGKTQISLQLLLSAQLPTSFGGLSSSSLYLYSESPFPIRRLHQLSASFPSLDGPLDGILTHPLHSAHHLLDVLSHHIDSLLSSSSIKLIVIDSIAALFRFEFDNNPRDLKQRSSLFFKISSKLKELARRFGLAIVVINQVVDVVDDSDGLRIGNPTCLYTSERKVSAALGLSWANCVNTRLFLSRHEERVAGDCITTQTRRFIRVVFAPHLPDSYSDNLLGLRSSETVLEPLQDIGQQLALTFNNEGSLLAIGGEDGKLRVYKWPSLDIILDQTNFHASVKDLDFSLDGKFIVSVGSGPCRIWEISNSTPVASLMKENDEIFGYSRFSPINDEQILYVTTMQDQGGSVSKWSTTTWKRINSKRIVRDSISAFNVSPNGKLLAIGTIEGDVLIVSSNNLEVQNVVKKAHLGLVTSLKFSEDSRSLLSTSLDSSVRVTLIKADKKGGPSLWRVILVLLIAIAVFYATSSGILPWEFNATLRR